MDLGGHGAAGGAREGQGRGGQTITIQLFTTTGGRRRKQKEEEGMRERKGNETNSQDKKTN